MKQELLDMFDELPLYEKIRRTIQGLKEPKSSGEYKYAHLQVLRLWSLVSAVLVPVLILLILLALPCPKHIKQDGMVITLTPEPPKPVQPEELPEIPPPKDSYIEPPEIAVPDIEDNVSGEAGDFSEPFSFRTSLMDTTPFRESPVVFKSLRPGPPGVPGDLDGSGPGKITEGAVIRALRWLKAVQEEDGAWRLESGGGQGRGATPAMTGLALLTFLARGETSASDEFGYTIQRGLEWLVANQESSGRFRERDNHDYSHPIATYALCEAYMMLPSPRLKESAELALDIIIKGQNADGGWDYNCKRSGRSDTSYMGWCVQALKAAHLAKLDNDGLETALKRAVDGFKRNHRPGGGFGYTSPASSYLTGVGVLSLQLLGAANDAAARQGLQWLSCATLDWDNPWGESPIYYWYYVTQAKFQAGQKAWQTWDQQMRSQIPAHQVILKNASADGKDIGYWASCSQGEHCKSYVYNTTLCTLMLEVYYKFLCTFTPDDKEMPANTLGDPGKEVEVIML